MKKLITLLLCTLMTFSAAGSMAAYNNPFSVVNTENGAEGSYDWDDVNGILKISESGMKIMMRTPNTSATDNERIQIIGGNDAENPLVVTLSDVNIKTSEMYNAPVSVSGHVKIILEGENKLDARGADYAAGLQTGIKTGGVGIESIYTQAALILSCGSESKDHILGRAVDRECGVWRVECGVKSPAKRPNRMDQPETAGESEGNGRCAVRPINIAEAKSRGV